MRRKFSLSTSTEGHSLSYFNAEGLVLSATDNEPPPRTKLQGCEDIRSRILSLTVSGF